jgi:recombinational DNA repair protein RecR
MKNVMVNNAVLNNNKYLDQIKEYLGVDFMECEICGETSVSDICKKCRDQYLSTPDLRKTIEIPEFREDFSIVLLPVS